MGSMFEVGSTRLTDLVHIGIAVRDADETAEFLSSIWDISGREKDETYEPKEDELQGGQPFSVRLVWLTRGTLTIELLEPLDEQSIWWRFIAEKGEGIHHIAFGVSDYDAMVSTFRSQGRPPLLAAGRAGERWCYVEAPGGALIELREEVVTKG
jgi:methylmalonyl-CoA/ethylmalonyl-CoA epimerase